MGGLGATTEPMGRVERGFALDRRGVIIGIGVGIGIGIEIETSGKLPDTDPDRDPDFEDPRRS